MGNFSFLKSLDKNLYDIISDAEKLYRDEYFEQSIGQTRRFAENICKQVLGSARTTEKTFDDMLATLKDKSNQSEQEREFIDDLYFLKREGNNSVHSSTVKKDGIVALECLQRAFEVSINYAVFYAKARNNLLKLRYDTELLVTGEKSKESLSEKYKKAKKTSGINSEKTKSSKKKVKQSHTMKPSQPKNNSLFWVFVGISSLISTVLVLTIYLLSFV